MRRGLDNSIAEDVLWDEVLKMYLGDGLTVKDAANQADEAVRRRRAAPGLVKGESE